MTVLSAINYQKLFESSPNAYLILAPNLGFTILTASDSYLRATLTVRQEIVGRSLFDVFPDNPDDAAASGTKNLAASLNRVIKTKAADTMAVQKYDIRRPDSQGGGFEVRHWCPMNSPVFDEKGEILYILHSVEDVTESVQLKTVGIEQHKMNEELKQRTGQLEKDLRSQRMEAMGQLAGGIAHDFNNFLTVMLMNCERMLEGKHPYDVIIKSFEQIKLAAEKAALLTRQLLSFSRKQVLQPGPVNLNEIIHETGQMLSRLIREDIQIVTSLSEDLSLVVVDPGQVEQLLINLVVNARDALPKGGRILIKTANATLDKGLANGNPPVPEGEYVMLSVHDTGIGMNASTQARIFEPFFTTKVVGKGTGLGLATVYGIVTQNKGTIWVYSELGKGSTFKIYLPRSTSLTANKLYQDLQLGELRGTETILVVEDMDAIREPLCQALEGQGYKVLEASNGMKAMGIIESYQAPIHLMISDVVMPEMGGQVVADKLHKKRRDTKVLFLSGYARDNLSEYDLTEGNPHFLEKPFSTAVLLKKVRSILG